MKKCLVTGGFGFIGFNAALRHLKRGWRVVVFDNLSRGTAQRNFAEARRMGLRGLEVVRGDVRNPMDVRRAFRRGPFERVVHSAGQVAVTTSVLKPREDFEINALGTLNLLEAVRCLSPRAFFIFASTNKVYGGMEWVRLGSDRTRYFFRHPRGGVDESAPLDFHSPYGCSKGCADQYVRDYSRIYGMRTAVFRQSCIYGPWQYGEEDQGWIAWFLRAALAHHPMTIYGDGRQVRDVLFIDDLLDLYDAAAGKSARCRGEIFNVGGGPRNTLSLLELVSWMEKRLGERQKIRRSSWRPGDQKVYISAIGKARRLLGWTPRVSVDEGLGKMFAWLAPRASSL